MRPLRRVIQNKIEDALSDSLLAGTFQNGDTVKVTVRNEDIVISRHGQRDVTSYLPVFVSSWGNSRCCIIYNPTTAQKKHDQAERFKKQFRNTMRIHSAPTLD